MENKDLERNKLNNHKIILDKYKKVVLDSHVLNLIWEHCKDYDKAVQLFSNLEKNNKN